MPLPKKSQTYCSAYTRLFHKSAAELRVLLHRTGLPLTVLAQVETALQRCTTCQQWAQGHSRPVIKTRQAQRFNAVVYGDIVFFSTFMVAIFVDESLRYTILALLSSKDENDLEQVLRRNWFRRYGPMKVFRTDRESAFASDQYGIFLERYGVQRELITAADTHSFFGILDRRVQLLRHMLPRLAEDLAAEAIVADPEDQIAESEFCLNSQLSYGGFSPYECLHGCQPHPIFDDESESLNQQGSICANFYEHQAVRAKAIAHFHQSLLACGLNRLQVSRPRKDQQQAFSIGQWVDIYRRPTSKNQTGWRGPCIVISYLGEGFLTIRWQSVYFDIPIHHCRPHVFQRPDAALGNSGPASAKLAIDQGPPVSHASTAEDEIAFLREINEFEVANQCEAHDGIFLVSDVVDTLQSLAITMKRGAHQIHAVLAKRNSTEPSTAALRDGYATFNLGKKLAVEAGIDNYRGVIIGNARRYVPTLQTVKTMHTFSWNGGFDSELKEIQFDGGKLIDWTKFTTNLQSHRYIAILEGHSEDNNVMELFEKVGIFKDAEHPLQFDFQENPNRLRVEPEVQDDPGPSVSERAESDAGFTYYCFEGKYPDEKESAFLTETMSNASTVDTDIFWTDDVDFGSATELFFSQYFIVDDNTEEFYYYPVERSTRDMTAEDYEKKWPEIKDARLKELKSWLDNKTMKPQLRTEFEKETGIRPIPCRWVELWKLKLGKVIAKCRLCLKGFAEPVSPDEQNSSPTANRFAHRIVCLLAVQNNWRICSMDVSVAFLRGFSFQELAEKGMPRKPVAVTPCEGVFELLQELDPGTYGNLPHDKREYVLRLLKGAYGLRDAPLLWHLKAVEVLRGLSFVALKHDTCVFVKWQNSSIAVIATLHVDDLLGTGQESILLELHKQLSAVFGELSLEWDSFKHFGIQVKTEKSEKGETVIRTSQRDYIGENLEAIEIPAKAPMSVAVPPEVVTKYRSLVSGIAWVGVTSPQAVSSASLLQGCLPSPIWEDIRKLNSNLQQLRETYVPLLYQKIPKPWRLLQVADSSFANSAKYSQGGYMNIVCHAGQEFCGAFCLVEYKSNKSKRVATSTMHAETLAKCSGLESAIFIQGFMMELSLPNLKAHDLIDPPDIQLLLPIVSATDCEDLHASLVAPAQAQAGTKHLTLYLASLREYRITRRLEAFIWINTQDMIANALTKLNSDGTANLTELAPALKNFVWTLRHAYKWNITWATP